VLTGYLGSAETGRGRSPDFIAGGPPRVNPDALHICDPVIGDEGGLYVPEAVAVEIRDRLFESADIVTPNRFELAWLTGAQAASKAIPTSSRPPRRIDIDGTCSSPAPFPLLAGGTGNLLVGAGRPPSLAEHRNIDNPPNGPGDLTAALFTGASAVRGGARQKALQLATASVFELVARACKRGADELMLETDAGEPVAADGDGAVAAARGESVAARGVPEPAVRSLTTRLVCDRSILPADIRAEQASIGRSS
jgi:pyridoxine kinase